MSEDKGGEYSKRLSAELKSSLYQRGQDGMGWDGGHMTPGDLQVGTPADTASATQFGLDYTPVLSLQ